MNIKHKNTFKFITWDRLEAIYVLGVLAHLRGNRTKTAKALGYTIRTFRLRLQRWAAMGFYIPKHLRKDPHK